MNPTYFQELYDYTAWANRRLWDCTATLSDEQFASIREPLLHVVAVERWWLHFLRTGALPSFDELASWSRETLRAKWDEVDASNREYLATLTPEELERRVRPPFWEGDKQPIKAWEALIQVANHSTDHRAQIMKDIGALGGTGVEQDFLTYLFEKQKQKGQRSSL
jgi:uncharacterized damage-inducible protein DinB